MKTMSNPRRISKGHLSAIKTKGAGSGRSTFVPNLSNKSFVKQHFANEQKRDGSIRYLTRFKENDVNNFKKKLLSIIARDFKAPLGAITLAADLIERRYDTLNQRDIFGQLTAIKTSAIYMTNIIDDFLTIENIEHKKFEAEIVSFDLKDFTQTVIATMKRQTKDWQDIKYVHTGSTAQVALDKAMLQHCLTNLISNAIKYSDVASHIEVETEIVGNTCLIRVKDYGIGIPEQEKEKLFEPFFRASNAAGVEGTGLGLNIVKRYTELMNGNINVKNNGEKGVVFTLVFPLTPRHSKHSDKDHARY